MWFVSRILVPKMLRVGKVGVKVSLKWPSSIGLMLQDLARLALWVQLQDKSRQRHRWTSKVSLSVLCCGTKSILPPTSPPNKTPTPAATTVKVSSPQLGLFRIAEWLTPLRYHLLPWHNPLVLMQHYSLLLQLAPPLRAPRVGLPAPVLARSPSDPLAQILHPDVWGWDPLLLHLSRL